MEWQEEKAQIEGLRKGGGMSEGERKHHSDDEEDYAFECEDDATTRTNQISLSDDEATSPPSGTNSTQLPDPSPGSDEGTTE